MFRQLRQKHKLPCDKTCEMKRIGKHRTFKFIFIFFFMLGPSGVSLQSPRRIVAEDLIKQEFKHDSVLTHEDLEKIQEIVRPVQFQDTHAHHGKTLYHLLTVY